MTIKMPVWFLLCLLPWRNEAKFNCLTCATTALRNKWQVTGFPKIISDHLFVESYCESAQTFKNWKENGGDSFRGALSPCNTACVSMILEFADADGIDGQRQYVRGCHSDLIGIKSQVDTAACETGTIQRINSEGKYVSTKAQMRMCNNDECNSDSDFLASGSGDGACGNNPKEINCRECWAVGKEDCVYEKEEGETDGGSCTGAWCTKMAGKIGDTHVVSRGCSPYNTIGKEDACVKIHAPAFFPTFAVQPVSETPGRVKRGNLNFYAHMCFCDTENCNGADTLSRFLVLPLLFLFYLLR